jgi:tol-pal system protein YbgF
MTKIKEYKKLKLFYFLLFFPFLFSCATTSDLETVKANVTGIQIEVSTQKKEITQINYNLSGISKEIILLKSDLNTLKEHSLGVMKEGQSMLLTQMIDLSKDLQSLKGQFDENRFFIDKSIKELLSERDLLQARLLSLENEIKDLKIKLSTLEKKNEPKPVDDVKKAEEKPEINPKKLYDDAISDLKEKRYSDSKNKLEKFIKDYPEHILIPSAYFYLGESYYGEKNFEEAILTYENFLKKYPENENTKKAMLKQALAFIEIGDKKTAKVILERLIEKFPKSNEAREAEKKLSEISPKKTNTIKKR